MSETILHVGCGRVLPADSAACALLVVTACIDGAAVRAPMEPTMLRYVCPHCGSKDAAPDKALHMRLPG